MLVSGLCELFVLFFLVRESTSSPIAEDAAANPYNDKYPLSKPVNKVTFRIAMIADLDKDSKFTSGGKTMWRSYLKQGYLTHISNKIYIEWDKGSPVEYQSDINERGRGMELSELVKFDGRLLTLDDRTGNIFDITKIVDLEQWIKLKVNDTDDDPKAKGFKSEWATVKDGFLYVGSMGREWRSKEGVVMNRDAMFVKRISRTGSVETLDWRLNFERLREKCNITDKGYMTHESGVWSDEHKSWFFLPRKCSKQEYDEDKDEENGCNYLIKAKDNFEDSETVIIDPENPKHTHGFSSLKFMPGTKDELIVALKTVELKGKTQTFIVVFDIKGKILYEEKEVSDTVKYEGIEFI